jgi:hypothetical protein
VTIPQAAADYRAAMQQVEMSPVNAEPEAQLTVPVQNLLESVAAADAVNLRLLRESQLDGVRPDFASLHDGSLCGWVELKAPGHTVDGAAWRGRERKQWEHLSQLDNLLVSNGEVVQRYVLGEKVGEEVLLPFSEVVGWDAAPLLALLRIFASARPPAITRVSQLANSEVPRRKWTRGYAIFLSCLAKASS